MKNSSFYHSHVRQPVILMNMLTNWEWYPCPNCRGRGPKDSSRRIKVSTRNRWLCMTEHWKWLREYRRIRTRFSMGSAITVLLYFSFSALLFLSERDDRRLYMICLDMHGRRQLPQYTTDELGPNTYTRSHMIVEGLVTDRDWDSARDYVWICVIWVIFI